MDGHRATKQQAIAGLLDGINRVVDDRRKRGCRRLCGVPVSLLHVKPWLEGGLEFPVLRGLLQVI